MKKFIQKDYINEFNKKSYKNYSFRLSIKNEKKYIDYLDTIKDKKQYILSLIVNDLENK